METLILVEWTDEAEKPADDMERMGLFAYEELEDSPWKVEGRAFAYWYDGVPGFAKEDFPKFGLTRRTVLMECLFSPAPENVTDEEGVVWTLLRTYAVGPERECPHRGETNSLGRECPLCQAPPGEEHGHAYLGEGWVEAVYESEIVEDE